MSYKLPPREIVEILDTPSTPVVVMSPDRARMLLVTYETYPPISLLARPFLRLGGQRIDPVLGGAQRTIRFTGITIVSVADGAQIPLPMPDGAVIGVPVWSFDGTRFAFTRDLEDGIELWVADAGTGAAHALAGVRVNDVLSPPFVLDPLTGTFRGDGPSAPFSWQSDNTHLLVRTVPPGRGPAPEVSRAPSGPRMEETHGKVSQVATFQDMLTNENDERLFEHFATSRLARAHVVTGAITPVGEPGIIMGARTSPDGAYLLVARAKRPFSYRVPYSYFSRTTQVWDRNGTPVAVVADLPVSDEIPRQGVPTGPRNVTWQPKHDATLLWSEALDGGDPMVKVPHRDRIMTVSAPFTAPPREVVNVRHRFAGFDWADRKDEVLLSEYDRDRRWHTIHLMDLASPVESDKVLFDLSIHDAYADPGDPIYKTKPNGERTMLQDGDWVYLAGRGASEQGDRPFLDRRNLETGETERVFWCGEGAYEVFVAFADDGREQIIIRHESPVEPANFFVQDLRTGTRRALTAFPDPHPRVTGMKKEMLRYTREDGVPLSGTLYTPQGWTPEQGRLPVLIWAYPMEYSDAGTAGQVRGSDHTFTRLAGASPLWFVIQGYAVLNDATMPVVGDPETMNDTYIEQVVASAKAAVDTLDAIGVCDRERVVVSGHSYGGFMTANLLAHSELFAAGIARSGAYNRTLTPFGFQSERRSYWEAPEVYHRVSPFMHAHLIKKPLLLIHGGADNNPGTYTIQTERMYQALQANGGNARLVILPHESHGYRARESVLHTLAEMLEWAMRYAGPRPEAQAPEPAMSRG
ncbi:MAG: S9 family peptidase [Chloroflexi bacterium]|nr:S9 family peptidase [Chloroflexota bacterium]